MDIRIKGWVARNIRGGLRDLKIDLGENPARWTLIQMPNGMGKTTTMSLFRWTLTEKPLPQSTVRDLRASDDVDEGLFDLQLIVDGKPFRLGLELDFRDGSARYYSIGVQLRGGGRQEGRRALPSDLRDLLKPDLAEMFVFNGELAKQMRDMTKQKADDAIRALYGLVQLAELTEKIKRLVDLEQRRNAALTTAKEERGMSRLRNARDEVAQRRNRLSQQLRTTGARLAQKRQEGGRLESLITDRMKEDEGLKGRLEDLQVRQADLGRDMQASSGEVLNVLRRPPHVHPRLLQRLQTLGGKLFELKLPESISAEFFRDLAGRDVCVCGRAISDHERAYIRDGAGQFLAQDQIAIINQMKLALRESAGDPSQLTRLVADLHAKMVERRALKGERDRLELERIASGDDELERLRAEFDATKAEVERLEADNERLTTRDSNRQRSLHLSWETNLPLCEAEFKLRDERLSTATKTRRFVGKAEIMKALIADVGARALRLLRERIRQKTNERLLEIARTETLEVTRIEGGLEIASPGLSVKADVSEGQSLSVAYAFLTSLLAEAPYRLPFIVDSPAVSLDNVGRREVGERIPEFFDQMIMFVISSERDGFGQAFYERGADVRYFTLSRLEGVVKIETGLEAFRSFQDRDVAA